MSCIGKIKEPSQAGEVGKQALTAVKAYASKDMGSLFKAGMGMFKAATGSQEKAHKKAQTLRASDSDVVSRSRVEPISADLTFPADFLEWMQGFSDEC